MVHAGTGRWRQKNGRPMLIVGSRPAVYRMAVLKVMLWYHFLENVDRQKLIQFAVPEY